jgi:hypothetical protein
METGYGKRPIVIVLASDCSRSRFKNAEKRPPLADARGSATRAATVRESVGFNQPYGTDRRRPSRAGLIRTTTCVSISRVETRIGSCPMASSPIAKSPRRISGHCPKSSTRSIHNTRQRPRCSAR